VAAADPELVLHLAGQARVDEAHRDPLGTFEVNALGVARLLERYADHGVDIAEQVVFAVTGRNEDLGVGGELRIEGLVAFDGSLGIRERFLFDPR
jgi:GDP-D-mannose dehydratase